MRRKIISACVLALVCLCARAQTEGYRYSAALDTIRSSGFYNIVLTPELTAHLKADLSDVRIVNAEGRWVPHVVRTPGSGMVRDAVLWDVKFRIAENTKEKTEIIAERSANSFSNLILRMRNTAAERFATLAGSDDEKSWFVISDSILINPTPDEKNATSSFAVSFPKSSYSLFRLTIKNNNKDPFDIKGISNEGAAADIHFPSDSAIENPATIIQQKDSGRTSYIRVEQKAPYHFNSIDLEITGPKYFNRSAEIYVPADGIGSYSSPGQLLKEIQLSNNSTLHFNFNTENAKVFYIRIDNKDNLPLHIQRITTANSYSFISSFLEKDKAYRLLIDNPAALPPQYDLANADRKAMDSGAFIHPAMITAVQETQVAKAGQKSAGKYIMWAAIIAALPVLLFFTLRMTKEIDKSKDNDRI